MVKKGIDIVLIGRMERAVEKKGLLRRVFTEKELEHAFSGGDMHRRLAGCFAAKEAAIKALDCAGGISLRDIEVVKEGCAPYGIRAHGAAASALSGKSIFLSIAYCGGYAVAIAAVEQ